ncbi:unnamed protein product [Orchesella dallaii]|uniref:Uncharacterized protein n=1 Tax=Orchesella dallaii TaxID=48710 RepID=A0ABP1S2W5_9HEXA
MKFLVTLALCAFCVSADELVRSKRGWGYEPTPPPPTQPPGWGWNPPPNNPPPPPPPPPPTQPQGWGQPPPPTQRPGWGGWNTPPPSNGWGYSSGNYGYNPSYGRYPRPWGQTRYNRYAEMDRPSRYRDFASIRGGSEPYRRSSLL